MVQVPPSELAIVARVEEAETVADLIGEKVTDSLMSVVGTEPVPSLEIGTIPCEDIKITGTVVQKTIKRVLKALCSFLEDLVSGTKAFISNLLADAAEALSNVIGGIERLVSGITETIVNTLNSVVATITERLNQALESIVRTVEGVVSNIADFVAGIVAAVERGVEVVLSTIGLAIRSLVTAISSAFGRLIDTAAALIDRIVSTVRQVGEFLVELARVTLDQMAMSVAAVLGPLIGAGQSVLGRIGDLIESVPGALVAAADAVKEGISEFVGDPLSKMGGVITTQVEEFFGKLIKDKNLSHGDAIRGFASCLNVPPSALEPIACAADDAAPETPAFFVAALAFLVPLIVAQFIGAALEPVAEGVRQEIREAITQALIPPSDLLDGFYKGDISDARLREDFGQAGFNRERTDLLVSAFRAAPDTSVQIRAWLRDLITEDDLDAALAQNRIRPEDVELIKQVVFFVPPAQDLIRMAVREVFSPEIRERFGQDEDFPEEFAKFARQQGISDEWARSYWAAHWALPSPAQGFEMLHRKVIEPVDLDVLLRALDVMPFWRDKLTRIAFSPLTRVDLRRMHALGLLTDKDLQTRYEAIGFGADDAALMVAFTVAFNFSEDRLPEELEGLTRASVLGMFDDGIILRDDAVALLTGMGIGSDAAELFVEQKELDRDRGERRDLIESIVQLAGGGRISLPQAQDSLAQLGITAVEITRAVGRILGKRDDRDRLPSLADLRKMHASEIIDDEVFIETLAASGFDDTWAARQFQLFTGREPA